MCAANTHRAHIEFGSEANELMRLLPVRVCVLYRSHRKPSRCWLPPLLQKECKELAGFFDGKY